MGVAVDGSTSYIPGDENPLDDIPSDEEEDSEEEQDLHTPISIGSKRTSSTQSMCSTTTSPKKKLKSPTVKAIVSEMKEFNVNHKDRTATMEGFLSKRNEVREEQKAHRRHLLTTSWTWQGIVVSPKTMRCCGLVC